MQEEIWKDIQGYEGIYQVSNLGRVKSLPRENRYYNPWAGKECVRNYKERIMLLIMFVHLRKVLYIDTCWVKWKNPLT